MGIICGLNSCFIITYCGRYTYFRPIIHTYFSKARFHISVWDLHYFQYCSSIACVFVACFTINIKIMLLELVSRVVMPLLVPFAITLILKVEHIATFVVVYPFCSKYSSRTTFCAFTLNAVQR